MDIRNSKIRARMLYENNLMQLHNKNMKINVSFLSHIQLLSVTHSFVTDNVHHFNRFQQQSANIFCESFPAYLSSTVEISWWKLSPCSSLTAPRFGGKNSKWEYKKLIFNSILHGFNKSLTSSFVVFGLKVSKKI